MRELPIPYTEVMVKSIIQNLKRMTRRTKGLEKVNENPDEYFFDGINYSCTAAIFRNIETSAYYECKPSYQVGDHLWIRESHKISFDSKNNNWICEFKDGEKISVHYKSIPLSTNQRLQKRKSANKWVSGRFMPKAFARLWIEVTNVRCERLEDISEADAIAEGIEKIQVGQPNEGYKEYYIKGITCGIKPIDSFFSLWMSINGLESMQSNPWVFVYTFKRIEKP